MVRPETVDTLPSDDAEVGDEVRIVNHLTLKYFRDRLVEHFNIMFRRGEVKVAIFFASRTPVRAWLLSVLPLMRA